MAQLALWNGDIFDLEVDAIVNPANVTLWMATGVAGAIKRQLHQAQAFAQPRVEALQGNVGFGLQDGDAGFLGHGDEPTAVPRVRGQP